MSLAIELLNQYTKVLDIMGESAKQILHLSEEAILQLQTECELKATLSYTSTGRTSIQFNINGYSFEIKENVHN